jgi:hypothetical protein
MRPGTSELKMKAEQPARTSQTGERKSKAIAAAIRKISDY